MQRRTVLQVLSAAFSALFVGVGKATAPAAQALLPARVVRKVWGPYVDILARPILQADGSLIVARVVNPARTGGRLYRDERKDLTLLEASAGGDQRTWHTDGRAVRPLNSKQS
jgi:hypothetical protein